MNTQLTIDPVLTKLEVRHLEWAETRLRPFYLGCRLKILFVADDFIYFDDDNFGLSEVVQTVRDMSTAAYPVTVDLAHRDNAPASRLAGGTGGFTFSDASLSGYDQIWIFSGHNRFGPAIDEDEQQAIRRFMDEGGGVFATGDHEDLGVAVGGYIPRVRSMRRWFWPSVGPQGEPVAPHGRNATRHDTNRPGHNGDWSFNDQSDDIPQTITPHFFGSGLWSSVHPLLCTSTGIINVLPDHAHEGECEVPSNLGGNYSIGNDSFREYPDGANGQPVAPVVVATANMLPGAHAMEFDKDPVPGGSFGVIAAWDGFKAGDFGRVVVDATWHHFININLIGDRGLGAPNTANPKTMGFLHSAAGRAHYERIKAYFRNIAEWLTPKSRRRCILWRHLWWATQTGWFKESFRANDPVFVGNLILNRHFYFRPCDRLNIVFEIPELQRWPWLELIDPPRERLSEIAKLRESGELDAVDAVLDMVTPAVIGSVALELAGMDFSVDRLAKEFGDDEAEVPELEKAAVTGLKRGVEYVEKRIANMGEIEEVLKRLSVRQG